MHRFVLGRFGSTFDSVVSFHVRSSTNVFDFVPPASPKALCRHTRRLRPPPTRTPARIGLGRIPAGWRRRRRSSRSDARAPSLRLSRARAATSCNVSCSSWNCHVQIHTRKCAPVFSNRSTCLPEISKTSPKIPMNKRRSIEILPAKIAMGGDGWQQRQGPTRTGRKPLRPCPCFASSAHLGSLAGATWSPLHLFFSKHRPPFRRFFMDKATNPMNLQTNQRRRTSCGLRGLGSWEQSTLMETSTPGIKHEDCNFAPTKERTWRRFQTKLCVGTSYTKGRMEFYSTGRVMRRFQ